LSLISGILALNLLLKRCMSPISYSKDWEADMIRSMEGFTFDSAMDLNMGYYHIKLDAEAQKLCTIVFQWFMGNWKIQTLTHGYQDCLVPDVFKTSCLSLSKIWNMLRPILMICKY
jgi:hypothetical protein